MPSQQQYIKVEGEILKLTHLEKVLYPAKGFTKADVINYYLKIAPVILPHLRDRPITLKRYPDGVNGQSFYEKNCPNHRPRWIGTTQFESVRHCLINDKKALIWSQNLASLELHTTLAKVPSLQNPCFIAFDLDPGEGVEFQKCAEFGLLLRRQLKQYGLECFPKTSGKKGLHVYVPLNSGASYAQTTSFARFIAESMERSMPDQIVSRMAKKLRPGKIFIDWSQNVDFKTTVCAYSLRANDHPTVTTPLKWSEVSQAAKTSSKAAEMITLEARDVIKRVEKSGDLFSAVLSLKQKLPADKDLKLPSQRFNLAA